MTTETSSVNIYYQFQKFLDLNPTDLQRLVVVVGSGRVIMNAEKREIKVRSGDEEGIWSVDVCEDDESISVAHFVDGPAGSAKNNAIEFALRKFNGENIQVENGVDDVLMDESRPLNAFEGDTEDDEDESRLNEYLKDTEEDL